MTKFEWYDIVCRLAKSRKELRFFTLKMTGLPHLPLLFLLAVASVAASPERYDSLEDFFENDDVNFDIDFDDAHDAAEV